MGTHLDLNDDARRRSASIINEVSNGYRDLAVEIQLFHDSGFEKVYRGRLVVAVEQDVVDGFSGRISSASPGSWSAASPFWPARSISVLRPMPQEAATHSPSPHGKDG